MLSNYILARLKYTVNKLVPNNLYISNTNLHFNNSQLVCREIQIFIMLAFKPCVLFQKQYFPKYLLVTITLAYILPTVRQLLFG